MLASFDFDDFNTQHRPEVMLAILEGLEKFLLTRTKITNGLTEAAIKQSKKIASGGIVYYPDGVV